MNKHNLSLHFTNYLYEFKGILDLIFKYDYSKECENDERNAEKTEMNQKKKKSWIEWHKSARLF